MNLLPLLAQLNLPGAPAATPEAQEAIRPIAPPVEVFPYPLWMVLCAGAALALLLGLLLWGGLRWWRRRPAGPPPTPRELAGKELSALQERVATVEPYPFSIEVSDVLRRFVSREFGVQATEQTSPEFLAAAASSPRFSEADKTLLGLFLEKADLIKFARINASSADSEQLLEQAVRFVKGGGE